MPLVSDALSIARAGVAAVDPGRAVRRVLRVRARSLQFSPTGESIRLPGSIRIVAFGKATAAMTDAAAGILGHRLDGGLAILPPKGRSPRANVRVVRAEHPVPGTGSLRAGQAAGALVESLSRDDRVLFLISGGGSALLEEPAEGLSLGDLQRTTELLLASGAPIQAMNAIRRHLSRVKGGWLAARSGAGQFAALAISDVVGDQPWEIASGPTVADPTTFRDAWRAAERYRLFGRFPSKVALRLAAGVRGHVPENPKPGDPRVERGRFALVASNRLAVHGAAAKARSKGYRTVVLSTQITGETREVARVHAAIAVEAARHRTFGKGPVALLSGGETTVTISGRGGRGGRDQEFALAAAEPLAGEPSALLLSLGTDGVDGPTDAAGGWVDGRSVGRAARRRVDLGRALEEHAAYDALRRIGGLVKTGPTGTNVMDLHVMLLGAARRGTAGSSRPGGARSNRRRRS